MKLIIDIRERELIKLLSDTDIIFEKKSLDVGDILFETDDGIFCVIERKSVSDLKASICDGRAREQKARLVGSGIPKNRILYLVEGSLNKTLDSSIYNMPVSTLVGSIINTQFRDGISVYKTSSINETTMFITRLFQKFKSDPSLYFKNENDTISEQKYASTLKVKKKDNVTPSIWFISQLCLIPQVTEKIAGLIVEKYTSVSGLILEYENTEESQRKNMLSNITYPIKNEKTRKVGTKISERIYKLFYNC